MLKPNIGLTDEEYKAIKMAFKEMTGLDPDNYSERQYQNWFYWQTKKEAETDKYIKEIFDSMDDIIKNQKYSVLYSILKNYDYYVKEYTGKQDYDMPFWCYGFNNLEIGDDISNGTNNGNNEDMRGPTTGNSN